MGSSKVINETLGYLLCYTRDLSPPLLGDLTLEDNIHPGLDIPWRRFRANIYSSLVENVIAVNCSKRMISASAAMPCPGLGPKSLLAATELSSALGLEL